MAILVWKVPINETFETHINSFLLHVLTSLKKIDTNKTSFLCSLLNLSSTLKIIDLRVLDNIHQICSEELELDNFTHLSMLQFLNRRVSAIPNDIISSLLNFPYFCETFPKHDPKIHSIHAFAALDIIRLNLDLETSVLNRMVRDVTRIIFKYLSCGGARSNVPILIFFRLIYPIYRRDSNLFWNACQELIKKQILTFKIKGREDGASFANILVNFNGSPVFYKPEITLFDLKDELCKNTLSSFQKIFDAFTIQIREHSDYFSLIDIPNAFLFTEWNKKVRSINIEDMKSNLISPFVPNKLLSLDILLCFFGTLIISDSQAYLKYFIRHKLNIAELILSNIICLPYALIDGSGIPIHKSRVAQFV